MNNKVNRWSNRATWLTVLNFENTNEKIQIDFEMCSTTKDLQNVFYKNLSHFADSDELMELRNEINWNEILKNRG